MKIGESWAYRARIQDPLAEVRIEALGEKRPLRAKIRFLDDAEEGRVDWVPPSRLKCLWTECRNYLDLEVEWSKLTAPFVGHLVADDEASQWIFDGSIDRRVAHRPIGRKSGLVEISDWAALTAMTGLTQVDLGPAVQFDEAGRYLPWPAAVAIAKAYLERHVTPVLDDIHQAVEDARRTGASGYFVKGVRGEPDRYVGPTLRNHILEGLAPIEATIRGWAGVGKAQEVDEIRELRNSLAEAAAMMNDTVRKLVKAGQPDLAWPIHLWLYPNADKRRWRSMLKKDASSADGAWQAWLLELHQRRFAIQVQTEVATMMLYGQEPARWAWSERPDSAE